MQAAYVRQYLESVRRRQAELAGRTVRGEPDQATLHDEKKGGAKVGSEGGTRPLKEEGGWVEAVAPPKLEPKPEVCLASSHNAPGCMACHRAVTSRTSVLFNLVLHEVSRPPVAQALLCRSCAWNA